jgi:hypothetical protein
MARRRLPIPARPQFGYRDLAEGEAKDSRSSLVRAWIILACLVVFYLGWTLTVFFLEPGLR